jgi:hypothetical protein
MNINALGQALECCKGSKDGTTAIISKILNNGESLELTYVCVVHYASEFSFASQSSVERDRAKSLLKDAVKKISKEYKAICKQELKTKVESASDSVEIISATFNHPRKSAYYKYHLFLTIS